MKFLHVRTGTGVLAFSWLLGGCFYITPEQHAAVMDADADADADADTDADTDTDVVCDADGDGAEGCGGPDCDDTDADIGPDVPEVCDGIDQDCDAAVDDGASDAVTWYRDADGDGSGGSSTIVACEQPADALPTSRDCDDEDATVNPEAEDICNGEDDNCDGIVDDGTLPVPSGYRSIQEALDSAPSGAMVCVAPGTYVGQFDFGTSDAILQGAGAGATILDGGGIGPVVTVSDPIAVPTIRGVTITGGSATAGAGLYVTGAGIVLEDVDISGNTCDDVACGGVGAYLTGVASLTDVTIRENEATPAQAEISAAEGVGLLLNGTGTLTRVTIADNRVVVDQDSTLTTVYGVGLYAYQSQVNAVDVTIRGNAASGASDGIAADGAGFMAHEDDSVFDGLTLEDNVFAFDGSSTFCAGGGAMALDATTSMTHLRVANNVADCVNNLGAALYLHNNTSIDVTNALIYGQSATSSSGASLGSVSLDSGAFARFTNVDVVGNRLEGPNAQGAGFYVSGLSVLELLNASIAYNELDADVFADGGAIYIGTGSSLDARYSNIYGNTAVELSGPTVDGAGMIAVEPRYTNVAGDVDTWDLALMAGSGLIDAGDPDTEDADGSRTDIGGFGGPGGRW